MEIQFESHDISITITDTTESEYLHDDLSGALADVGVSCCTCSCSCCC